MSKIILWKKSPQTKLYIDIFAIKHSKINLYQVEHDIHQFKKKEYIRKTNFLAIASREAGKVHFSSGKYVEAMKSFNNGLSLAENGSEEMGLALANRSACFFQLNMLQECLTDIEMAKKSNYPAHLMHKLDARFSKCKDLMESEQFNTNQPNILEPELSFGEHVKHAGVADCLEIRNNDKFGRHIITTRDLKIGQTILVEEPFSIGVYTRQDKNRDRCLGCSKYGTNFITCKNCINGLHCNEDCMKNSFHNIVCNIPSPGNKQEEFEMILKTIFNAINAFNDVDSLMHTVELLLNGGDTLDLTNAAQRNFCMLFQLVNHHEKLSSDALDDLRLMAAFGFVAVTKSLDFKNEFTSIKHQRFLQHLILHFFHVGNMNINLHEYVQVGKNPEMGRGGFLLYAFGMYPFGCYINHSCLPNVWMISVDHRLICKVIRPIKKGEQIFRSYIDPYEDSFDQNVYRKLRLENQFRIKCECVLCTDDEWTNLFDEVSLEQSPLWKDAITPVTMTVNTFRNLPRGTMEQYVNRAIKFLKMYSRFHPLRGTMDVQWGLIIMWDLFTTRF